ncbi:deoxyadenosine kinase [Mesotoga sp. Brook.08.YT.4.2.5.1]|jgi:deoxyguanosine kinase|uniref:Deoxynucleoside kinase n=3 Tax=Mesotoga TaxID=1184396 RepID=A0A117M386_9BACT|nr:MULTISPECIES: deoxynucleoside kinase [unclassified Mesotoga]KUK81864.1 MAG: Deoxynucleoside kinase [Mesotoga prima]PNE22718.1 deoxyadenosine kinase [Mesotoga sp. Brook.08.YT.4.2.5.1]PNQ06140.1 deoxyadenosine kinase [Mesotoga sp. SC_NapDC3]PXF35452.1 deoxyadenosine kinase [Mesotoga sp. SC_NapDC]RAM60888.1 deoxyadenosine kinase [Mesotoga sp. SC_4PWA21]RAO95867.1 deoxyadenosine kinase [Mesotoga sp. Brook.08.YT.4.2.5.4.]RDI94229.1 deoxyadenosine kinase [Mesotoga sp. Brook.08.YT.4.2.5.2.]RIZ6
MMFSKVSGKYVSVEGVIGVGKTTLVKLLSQKYTMPTVLEVVEENPFLTNFYEDMDRWAFQTQLFFLISRFDQQSLLKKAASQGQGVISDYAFVKDHLFASLTLKGEQLRLYEKIFNALKEQVLHPDLIVYLFAEVDILMNRIALRDRPFERRMDRTYIAMLGDAYEEYMKDVKESKVLRIDTSNIDFVRNHDDLNTIFNRIEACL